MRLDKAFIHIKYSISVKRYTSRRIKISMRSSNAIVCKNVKSKNKSILIIMRSKINKNLLMQSNS